jgi:hypothetical protein
MVRDLSHQSTYNPALSQLTGLVSVIVDVQSWGIDKSRHFGVFSLFFSKLVMRSFIIHLPVPRQPSPNTVPRQASYRRSGETWIPKKFELLSDSVKTRTCREERRRFLGSQWTA